MAVTWQHYGLGVLVAGGIAVTGTLWHHGRGAYVAGEDIAALLSARAERQIALAVDAPGATPAGVSTSYVSGVILRHGLQDALDGARGSLKGLRGATETRVRWLDINDTLPATGAEIARTTCTFTQITNWTEYGRTYRIHAQDRLPGAGATLQLKTLDTRVPSSLGFQMQLANAGSGTNLPSVAGLLSGLGFVSSAVVPSDGTLSGYWAGFGNWWTANLSGSGTLATNLYGFTPWEKLSGSSYVLQDYVIRTNTFNAARAAFSAMRRTIYFPDFIICATNQYRLFNAFAETNAIAAAAALSAAKSSAKNSAAWVSSEDLGGGAYSRLLNLYCEMFTDAIAEKTNSVTYAAFSRAGFTARQQRAYGIRFGYPCAAAYAAGIVGRVRVYAVATGSRAWPAELTFDNPGSGIASGLRSGWHAPDAAKTFFYTPDTGSVDADLYNASSTLGIVNAVAGRTIVMSSHQTFLRDGSFLPVVNASVADYIGNPGFFPGDEVDSFPRIWKWSLVSDSGTSPSAETPFDFVPADSGILSATPLQDTVIGWTEDAGGGVTYEWRADRSMFRHAIDVQFVVVVDWDFNHMAD